LRGKGTELEEREYGKTPLTEKELRAIIGDSSIADFLNSRNALYRERRMKEHPPGKEEGIRLILKEQNLLKRPVIIKGKRKILGFSEPDLKGIL